MLRYHEIATFSDCKILLPFCNSTSKLNLQIYENFRFLWCILVIVKEYHINKHVSLNWIQGGIPFPIRIKIVANFEQLKSLNKIVFKLSSFSNALKWKLWVMLAFPKLFHQKISTKTNIENK